MEINNPLKMNDWDIKSFLWLTFSLQFALLILILLDAVNIQIPLLRELISFIILLFIPGVLMLRILRLHDLGNTRTVFYSVGLSIISLMLIGLFMNSIYPLIGISKPFSLFNLFITINLFLIFFSILSYLRDKDYAAPEMFQLEELLSPSLLFLCLIPFISIFGTYMLNAYGDNTLQMILLLIIAIFPLITFKWIPKKLYPLVIFVLALSLLLHTTLVGPYIWGSDINIELIMANYVIKTGIWYPDLNIPYNAMLSVVLLTPIYSVLSDLSITWCFKVVYSVLFALVPVILFEVYNKLSNEKISFLACIFFINLNAFFTVLPAVARQEIASIFLALILIVGLEEKIRGYSKSILMVLFGFGLVVSHYGMAYVFLLIIGASILILIFFRTFKIKLIENIEFKNYKIVNIYFALFLACFALTWFIYVSNYSIFQNGSVLGYLMFSSLNDLFNPSTSQGYYIISTSMSYYQSLERFLYIIGDLLIAIGILNLTFDKKINSEFKVLSIASFLILVIAVIFPYFAAAMNTDRIFYINLFFLAVFFVSGFLTAIRVFNRVLKKVFKSRSFMISAKNALYLLCLFLIVFSIFNSAFIYQVFDQPKMGRFALENTQDFYMVNNQEITGINWLKKNNVNGTEIYADVYKFLVLESLIYSDDTKPLELFLAYGIPYDNSYSIQYQTLMAYDNVVNSTILLGDAYVFMGMFNIHNKKILVADNDTGELYYLNDTRLENKIYKLYDNGDSWILKGKGVRV